MFITTENPCSLSHVTGKISSCGTAWEVSIEYGRCHAKPEVYWRTFFVFCLCCLCLYGSL